MPDQSVTCHPPVAQSETRCRYARRLSYPTVALVAAMTLVLAGCPTTDPYIGEQKTSNSVKGAGIGGVGGALVAEITWTGRKPSCVRNCRTPASA